LPIAYTDRKLRLVAGFLLLLASLGYVWDANATHEADHRYVLSGYVRDSVGLPIPGAKLVLEHKGGEKKSIKTNEEGYYEVLFHLHNSNLGDEIILKYGETVKKHKVSFDPKDKFTNRGVSIDFGAPGKEGAVVWIYLTGGVLALFACLVYFGLLRKPKRAGWGLTVGKGASGSKKSKRRKKRAS